jgi:uncharacterized metal-binding protein YceD (DUF177 family)
MSIETSWFIPIADVAAAGTRLKLKAGEAECRALAASLEILDCKALDCDLRLRPLRQGRFQMTGTVRAEVVQACVVSLEPLDAVVEENIDVEFWPQDQIAVAAKTDDAGEFFDPEAKDGPEPIENARIVYGRLVFECISAGLDPYPRRPDATLAWQEKDEDTAKVHPFAALAKLKPKS